MLRKNVHELAAQIYATPGITDRSLSSNGTQLENHVPGLRAAGNARLNVSLDTPDPFRFAKLTKRGALGLFMQGGPAPALVCPVVFDLDQ